MNSEWPFPGSRWWKIDFHSHSPKSDDYGRGNKSLKNIDHVAWLQKAMEAKLDCVVITDHNSGGWIDGLKEKNNVLKKSESKPEWFRDLTVFPGVEITVADSSNRIHLLAVFDPLCDSQKITAVLGSCGINSGFGDDMQTSTTTGFIETVKKITKANGVAIPAHIDGPKGLLCGETSLTPELKKSLEAVTAAEFCNLNTTNNTNPELNNTINHLAKLGGSDAHTPDEIGRNFSWIKMSHSSIEGLRLALMDQDFCVKNQPENPNQFPDSFLSRLSITAMQHCGRIPDQPFTIELHPHFNAIIGGRGTGKSTILESIRIASRRENELKEVPKIKDELDKFMKLSQYKGIMLNDTEILLEIQRRAKSFRNRWRFDGQGAALEELEAGTWQAVEPGDIKERFPISIYSQKQINELALNPKGLLEVIDRSPEVDRTEWQSRWDIVKSQFLQLRERSRELLRQLSGEQQKKARLQDVENDLKQYEEKGHGSVLKQYQKRSQQRNGLLTDTIFNELSAEIRKISQSADLSDFPSYLFDDGDVTVDEMKGIHIETAQELKSIRTELNTLADRVDLLKRHRNDKIESSKWSQSLRAGISAYQSLVTEYEEKQSQLSISLYGEWVKQRNQLQQQLKHLDSINNELISLEKERSEIYAKLLNLRDELLNKRKRFLNQVIGNSSFVRMELVQFGDVTTLEEEYRSILNLDDGRFTSSICDNDNRQGILWDFFKWEEKNIPESDLPGLISVIKIKTIEIAEGQDSGRHGAFDNRLNKTMETQPSIIDSLDVWWPEDLLKVKYSKDPMSGKFDDLEKGSAGQKAAAILAFLLSYGQEPLIIDQPEDDLDNALIYNLIVNQIHENKNRRQLIIVTHNPNIVVNGDAELVHVLKFHNGQVQPCQEGGLQEEKIRESICVIMEGGQEAFDKRYKRIMLKG